MRSSLGKRPADLSLSKLKIVSDRLIDKFEITLKRKNNTSLKFTEFPHSELERKIQNNEAIIFDMNKLEREDDYDTDQSLLDRGRGVLCTDLYHAVEFFMQDDPLKLVVNLECWMSAQFIVKKTIKKS